MAQDADPNQSGGGIVQTTGNSIVDHLTGMNIPAPIQRNMFKAFSQLCAAAIGIPVASMEGIASEKRALTKARIELIERSSKQISDQMNFDPIYAEHAVRKFGEKVLRERVNLDQISEIAAKKIEQTVVANKSIIEDAKEIGQDWINTFESEASQKSSDEMQEMFGKVLAGEITSPESFSIKTIKLLSNLDQETAEAFKRVCSIALSTKLAAPGGRIVFWDVRAPVFAKTAGENGLGKYGLSFDKLNLLVEHGLIITDLNSYRDFGGSITLPGTNKVPYAFKYNKQDFGLKRGEGFGEANDFRLNGVAFSKAGRELSTIVETEFNEVFFQDFKEYLAEHKLELASVYSESASL